MKTLIISGQGRCGTSLAMQLLDDTGYPCYGEYPSYEEQATNPHLGIAKDFLKNHEGKAIKILEPQNTGLDFSDCFVVYLQRNTREQAKSGIKFASLSVPVSYSRSDIIAMEKGLRRDNKLAIKLFKQQKVKLMAYSFEDLLKYPGDFIQRVSKFIDQNLEQNPRSYVVRKRGAECYDGFLEMELLNC